MFTKLCIVVLCLLGVASAQVVYDCKCPTNVEVDPNFNLIKYLGVWYEYAKYPVTSFELNATNVKAEYTLLSNGYVLVVNSMVNGYTGVPSSVEGRASAETFWDAKLSVSFVPGLLPTDQNNYWVLGTDHTSYSVVYSCQNSSDNKHTVTVWILTRSPCPASSVTNMALNVLITKGISVEELELTKQEW